MTVSPDFISLEHDKEDRTAAGSSNSDAVLDIIAVNEDMYFLFYQTIEHINNKNLEF